MDMKGETKKVTNNQLQCEIVQDLLPLYHDDVVNTVTKEAVKQHLNDCRECTKEYEELCQELPQENVDNNIIKSKFNSMQKRLKKKRIIKMALIALTTCVLMILMGYVLLAVPIVPVEDDEFQVKAAYKVQKEDKTYLLMFYTEPEYDCATSLHMRAEQTGDGIEVIFANMKKTVIDFTEDKEQGAINYDWIEIADDTRAVAFAGEFIWSEEKNGNEEIPEYVNQLNELETDEIDAFIVASDEYIEIHYEQKGRIIRWDLEGNVIRERYYDDAASKYFEGTVLAVEENYMLVQPYSKYWLADQFDTIYVSMNTANGQTPKDLKNVEIGEVVGVDFCGEITGTDEHRIDEVSDIVIGGEDNKKE